MTPKQLIEKWVHAFNNADTETLCNFYSDDAVNHQVVNDPVVGKKAIRQMFAEGFAQTTMVCIPENIFEDGEWGMLEWKDPEGLRGCGFFHVINGKIVFQRGYWDRISFHRLHNIPFNI